MAIATTKPVVLALDLATKTGWAIGQRDRCLDSGVWSVPKSSVPGRRWFGLWQLLDQAHTDHGFSVVVVEGLVFASQGGAHAQHVLAKMHGVAELWAYHHKAIIKEVKPNTLKKAAAGHGFAKKPQMIMAANRRWPTVMIADDNHADALCLLGAWLDGKV